MGGGGGWWGGGGVGVFFFQAEDGIRDWSVTGVQTCALPICISSGQGLMAVALVIFARWNPLQCLWASLLFGGAQALGPAFQSVGINAYYYLFNAAP